jgi:hypothetical protein
MIDPFPGVRTARWALAVCCAGAVIAALIAPAEAQGRYRGKPERAKRDSAPPAPPGPHLLVVSLKGQHATLYANGAPIARTPISSGTASHPTPTGVFSVIQKNRHHRSNIYSGAPMPFMQRLTWSGIALHQGQLPGYPASHGCIRLPGDFAHFLWRTTRLGARVIVTHGDATPTDIAHPKLFQPKPPVIMADAAPQLRRAIETDIVSDAAAGDIAAGDKSLAAAADPTAPATEISAAGHARADIPPAILASFFDTLAAKEKKPAPAGPVSVFVSRKDRQVYVRQGFQPLFNVPAGFRDESASVGTHVFTALDKAEGAGLRWVAVSVPEYAKADKPAPESRPHYIYRYDEYGRRLRARLKRAEPARQIAAALPMPSAADALDRIELPQETRERISDYITAGATLIVSDHGLGHETGAYTDFIVLTR